MRGYRLSLLVAALLLLVVPPAAEAQVAINEVLAANATGLLDEDGDYEDWIEVYNPGAEDMTLTSWGLSDDPADPMRWRFPQTALRAGQFLLVYASGKNRREPYVDHWETVIDWGDLWRYRPGFSEPPADWRFLGFDDSGWDDGPSGFGFEDGDDATEIPQVVSCHVRKTFFVEDVDRVVGMRLHVDPDDGFVAYLNGTEVARFIIGYANDPPPPYDQPADYVTEALIYTGRDPLGYDLVGDIPLLVDGENVLAIQVHDNTNAPPDMTLIPFLTLGLDEPPPDPRGISETLAHLFARLHTNFKLSTAGEELLLSDAFGARVDSIHTGQVISDVSRGRQPDGGPELHYFAVPTPKASNDSEPLNGFTSPPIFSLPGGLYQGQVVVYLYSPDPTATIRWTGGGWLPTDSTETSQDYTGPILVDSTTVLRARCFKDGQVPSSTVSHSYFFGESPTLATVSLVTDPDNLWHPEHGIHCIGSEGDSLYPYEGANFWQDWERPVHVEFFDEDELLGFAQDAGIQVAGDSSRVRPQKSLKLVARDAYGENRFEYPLYPGVPIDEFKQIILRNSGTDWCLTHFRDGLMQHMAAATGVDVQAYRPALIFLNGEYWGILNLRERQSADWTEMHYGVDPDSVEMIRWPTVVIEGDSDAWDDLIEFIEENDLSIQANYDYVASRMEIASFIDYNIANIYYANMDWPVSNSKWWRPTSPGGRWRYLAYDMDAGLGFGWFGPHENALDRAINPSAWHTYPFGPLLAHDGFRRQFINAYADRMNTTYTPANMHAATDSVVDLLDPEMLRHLDQWGGPWGWDYNHWLWKVSEIRDFIDDRPAYAKAHVMDEFGLPDTLRLTLDVSPPGAGSIALTAISVDALWSGNYFVGNPIALTAQPGVGYGFLGWSDSGVSGTPSIEISPEGDMDLTAIFRSLDAVVINEINYHSADAFDPGDWVELTNHWESAVDIGGWIFKDSEDAHAFALPLGTVIEPGEFLVLCRDTTGFKALFPDVDNYLGNLAFGFSGNGELLRLYADDGVLLDLVEYDDAPPWPTEPDGNGPTLELRHPDLDNSLAGSWLASGGHGTPGERNSVYGVGVDEAAPPREAVLLAPYPNPFNPRSTFRFGLPVAGRALLRVFDVRGREVDRPLDAELPAGWHDFVWRPEGLASGVYFCRLEIAGETSARKVLLLK